MPTEQVLLFFLAEDIDDRKRRIVQDLVESLTDVRPWSIAPPQFVDEIDSVPAGSEDPPIQTLGGLLRIHGTEGISPLPAELDERDLADVEAVVDGVLATSASHSLCFEFELDGIFVGAIDCGIADDCLAIGLLAEWRCWLSSGPR
jgi:hypothetical protein